MPTPKYFLLLAMCALAPAFAMAQDNISDRDQNLRNAADKGWDIEVKGGLNIGGATPLGMPRSIRHISSYNPHLNGSAEAVITKWLDKGRRWGVGFGFRLEEKRMSTGADVKNYHTEIIQDGDRVAGYWTGHVKTDYYSTEVAFPVTANYLISPRWKTRAGMFFSYRFGGKFSGEVSDGYLRNDTPTGEKVTFDNGSSADYDFSDDLRKCNWGLIVGASWSAYRHFFLAGDISYSFGNIFKPSFHTVTFTMHPIYFNLAFGYHF